MSLNTKKTAVSLALSLTLTGCFSDSGNNNSAGSAAPGLTPDFADKIAATLMDIEPISGVSYNCNNTNDKGITSDRGEFFVSKGAVCNFSIDGYSLGKNRQAIDENNKEVTTYHINNAQLSRVASQEQHTWRISALVQSLDLIANDNKFDLNAVDGNSLISLDPLNQSNDASFLSSVAKVKIRLENNQLVEIDTQKTDFVSPTDAGSNLNNQFTSQNVKDIVEDLQSHLESDSFAEENLDDLLAGYRAKLAASDDSNGRHQRALSAILEIAEVLNMPEVSNRITIKNGKDYAETLTQVIDALINPLAVIELLETSQGTTDDVAAVLTQAAQRLVNASNQLGQAMPGPSYILPYFDKDNQFDYQDSLVIRSAALVSANLLYTFSSYQLGDDDLFLPKSQQLNDVKVVSEINLSPFFKPFYQESTKVLDVEYTSAVVDPAALFSSSDFLQFRPEAKSWLVAAKNALSAAVKLAKEVELGSYLSQEKDIKATAETIDALDQHLNGKTATLSYQHQDQSYYLDLHKFYGVDTGIDGSDIQVNAFDYRCSSPDLRNVDYNMELSMVFGELVCSHEDDYMYTDEWSSYPDYNRIKVLDFSDKYGVYQRDFVRAVNAKLTFDLQESSSSNARDVLWCGVDEQQNKLSCF